MARKARNGAKDMIEHKRKIEREMEELRAAIPELREAARMAKEEYREMRDAVGMANLQSSPECVRLHGV